MLLQNNRQPVRSTGIFRVCFYFQTKANEPYLTLMWSMLLENEISEVFSSVDNFLYR